MSIYFDIISNRRKGPLAGLSRAALAALSLPYRCGAALRNWSYDHFISNRWLDCPCISVGNLTAGGTGKTPVVIWLADQLIRTGKKVAIISRGYKSDACGSDELQLLSQACQRAICIAHPDRVRAGQYAVQEHHVDVVLLDDAFQHRRLGRDLDIVLLDASCPFGYDHLLPRGLLRESAAGLRRADVVLFTRLAQTTPQDLAALKDRCHRLNPGACIMACNHKPVRLVNSEDGEVEITRLDGRRLLAFAGIGNPQSFVHTLTHSGAKPACMIDYADHHHYTMADCERLSHSARQAGAELLVTTEKDLVKLRHLKFDWPLPLYALGISIDFVGEGGKMLLTKVNELFETEGGEDGTPPLPTDRPR